ncbi:hypothetical protein WN55_08386 [Dufourea novaeangliae]|uniref:Uncharacterized protein n=1 Tax=Dufourea novaeangliae TaxID=178035 RepID=A0A154P8E1_DUFNO|nr:hypothetical protein WN55_08386 [Dufourea novaeangliae]
MVGDPSGRVTVTTPARRRIFALLLRYVPSVGALTPIDNDENATRCVTEVVSGYLNR